MNSRRKNVVIAILPLILIPFVFIGAYIYNRYIRIYVLPCQIKMCTGLYCPGCGGTRCIYALLRGDIIGAIRSNAIVVAALLIGIMYWIENVFTAFGKRIKIIPESRVFIITVSGIALIYVIARNFIPIIAPV